MTGSTRPTRKGCPNRPVAFKRELAMAACVPGVSVAKLALTHGVNTNLLFKWRRQYRAGKFGTPVAGQIAAVARGPTPVRPSAMAPMQLLAVVENADAAALEPLVAGSIEIVFPGVTVRIGGRPELTLLRTVLDCLARHR